MTKVEQVYTTYIRTTPQKLWDALTSAEFSEQYWGGRHISDWKKGSKWKLIRKGADTPNMVGSVLESNPPNKLVVSWAKPDDKSPEASHSRVTYLIEPVADSDMVRLDVIHGNLEAGSDMHTGINNGWPRVLSSLKSFLETGKALDIWVMKGSCDEPKVA
jgi:uncharacterized protein YndB with AHSA1/START domain